MKAMNVLVRNLPDSVHRTLQERANKQGQSLQQFLVAQLTRMAATPTLEEALERISRRSGGRVGARQAVADLRQARAQR